MTLRDMIAADSQKVFLNTGEFAEPVVYVKGSGVARPIKAVVFREELSSSEESGGAVTPIFEVHVENDSVNGIASTELDTGGDQIEIPVRDGMTAACRSIISIVSQDHGMMVLMCR